ncbi:MAG: hypothetical protein WBY24_11075, partial [Candidatus Acidiferrales bacterium]
HQHIERGGCSLSKEPFSWLESHIGDSLRQPSAFGFIETDKDFCLSQLFCSEHVPAPQSLELIVTLMYHRMLWIKARVICLGIAGAVPAVKLPHPFSGASCKVKIQGWRHLDNKTYAPSSRRMASY